MSFRNFIRKIYLGASLLSIVLIGIAFTGYQQTSVVAVERTIDASILFSNQHGVEYLDSYKNAELVITDNRIGYKAQKQVRDFYEVEYLSNSNFSDYILAFEVTYIKTLDILFLDIVLHNKQGDIVETEKVFGYVTVDDNGNEDILFDFYGYYFLGSDFGINSFVEQTSASLTIHNVLADIDGGGGSIVYPILNISYSIVGLDQAKSNALNIVQPPSLLVDGPVKYLMYAAKLIMIQNDFNHNSSQTKPVGFINDQNNSKWTNWKFGISTMYDSGCGIIAMYNFLYDTGNNPDLATLIALTQLSNADLAYGIFGTNPIPEEYLQLLALSSMVLFDLIIYPIAAILVPGVAAVIVANFISQQPWWMQIILGLNYGAAVVATTITIEAALFASVVTANVFIANYFSDLHDIADVLSLYNLTNISTSLAYNSYTSNLSNYRYSIVSYWNGLGSNGLIDFGQGAHTIYVKRDPADTSKFIDYNNGNYYLSSSSTVYSMINSNFSNANKQFISGIVVKG